MKSTLPSLLISIPDGVIDLGWGHPSPRLHPLDELRKAVDSVLSNGDVTALQYGATQGFGPLLETLAQFLSEQEWPQPRSMTPSGMDRERNRLKYTLDAFEGEKKVALATHGRAVIPIQ